MLERGFPAATQFYAFPEAHWPRLRTTNGLERLHGEIKRRIKAAGAFPDGVTVATSTCPSSRHRTWPRQLNRSTEELRSAFYTQIGT